ncbi:uncharacterized protein LOC144620908 [Crassostrea virginica]
MIIAFSQHIFYACLCWLCMTVITAGMTLTVIPSGLFAENQSVTLQCELNPKPPTPIVVSFIIRLSTSNQSSLCALEPSNGICKETPNPCRITYHASCPNDTLYIIHVAISRNWNGASVFCQSRKNWGNSVVISVKVPITSVTLTPTSVTVIAGQQMNLTCATSYCNPPANIT